jgi:hypothetical protein
MRGIKHSRYDESNRKKTESSERVVSLAETNAIIFNAVTFEDRFDRLCAVTNLSELRQLCVMLCLKILTQLLQLFLFLADFVTDSIRHHLLQLQSKLRCRAH